MSKKTKLEPAIEMTPTLQELMDRLSSEEIETGILKQRSSSPELLEPWTLEATKTIIEEAILAQSVSEMLSRARAESELSLQEAGNELGVTRGRIFQLEQPDANLELKTLVRYAHSLGYDLELRLEPKEVGKSRIITRL